MEKAFLKLSIFLFFLISAISCKSQEGYIEINHNEDLKYYLSSINELNVNSYSMYSNAVFLKIFIMDDSKATPDDFFEGYDGILQSLLITINPDGDYYTQSKLFKIEGVLNPQIVEIKELEYPNFKIVIEIGNVNDRVQKSFDLNAKFD